MPEPAQGLGRDTGALRVQSEHTIIEERMGTSMALTLKLDCPAEEEHQNLGPSPERSYISQAPKGQGLQDVYSARLSHTPRDKGPGRGTQLWARGGVPVALNRRTKSGLNAWHLPREAVTRVICGLRFCKSKFLQGEPDVL